MESGQADVGFVALPVKRPLEMELLVRDPLLAPDSPFATHKRFPKKALASEPYIKLDSGEYSEMDRLFRVNGVEPRARFSIVSDYAAMGMVAAGLGYRVLSGLVLRNAPFGLVALPAEVPAYREIALAQKSSVNGVGRCAGLHQVHERLDPRSLRKRTRGAAALGASKNEAGAIPTSFRLRRALLHDPHIEGAHENHGHALAGDGIAGPEVPARRLVVALDEALRRRPGEGAARPA